MGSTLRDSQDLSLTHILDLDQNEFEGQKLHIIKVGSGDIYIFTVLLVNTKHKSSTLVYLTTEVKLLTSQNKICH